MERNIDIYASKLGDEKLGMCDWIIHKRTERLSNIMINRVFPVADVKVRANVATELRDSIEPLCSGASYPIFLSKLWPVFKTILKGDPVFFNMSYEQVRSPASHFPPMGVFENEPQPSDTI